MKYSAKNLIKILEQKGYYFKQSNGSHHLYYNSASGRTIIVPVLGNKDLSKGFFFDSEAGGC